MGDRSKIEWTDASWNPVTGCTEVSPGCDHCYAARMARTRLKDVYLAGGEHVGDDPGDPFSVRLWRDRLDQPIRWKRPRTIFVNSMSDLFHKAIPGNFIWEVWDTMLRADWHTYQVLTKRPARAAALICGSCLPMPGHIWVGTSIESQEYMYRARHLRGVPAKVRFLSCEPLLGPVEFRGGDLGGIHWVIAGGESGPDARPLDLEWVRSIRDQCVAASVPFFFKQVGGRTPKAGGRLLDGREWDEMPAR